jgi:hypothetical protein
MKKTSMKTLVFVGILALLATPVIVRAVDNDGPPYGPRCGGHPPVPPFFAEKYDANHDGTLSDAEEKTAQEAFMKQYDTNKDGKLSFDERKAVHADSGKAFFAKADTSHDGKLTPDEFNAAWAKFPIGPGGPGGPKGHKRGGWFKGGGNRPCTQ